MKLSILMASLSSRNSSAISASVEQQIQRHSGEVEFLVESDSGELTSGQKRNMLMGRASGEYVAFIDDDDTLAEDYVDSLLTATSSNPDVITFNVTLRGARSGVWVFGMGHDDLKRGVMLANHLCAWKSSIASTVAWCPFLGYADDQCWYKPVHLLNQQLTHRHVDKSIYIYNAEQATDSGISNHVKSRIAAAQQYVGGGLRVFRRGSEGVIEHRSIPVAGQVFVRDSRNYFSLEYESDLKTCGTFRIA